MSDQSAASVLPRHSTGLEVALEHAGKWVDRSGSPINTWNPESCPIEFLQFLSWGLSGDTWSASWSDDIKRAYARATIDVHRKKGTIGGVKLALKSAGYGDAVILERYGWNFYNGQRSRDGSILRTVADHWAEYRIILARPITIGQADKIREILKSVAPARCHLKAFDFSQALHLFNGQLQRDGQNTRGLI